MKSILEDFGQNTAILNLKGLVWKLEQVTTTTEFFEITDREIKNKKSVEDFVDRLTDTLLQDRFEASKTGKRFLAKHDGESIHSLKESSLYEKAYGEWIHKLSERKTLNYSRIEVIHVFNALIKSLESLEKQSLPSF